MLDTSPEPSAQPVSAIGKSSIPPPDFQRQIGDLSRRFHEGWANYSSDSYNEAQLRIEFLNPLFSLLGWDIDNAAGRPSFSREVVHEASVFVEEDGATKKKHPDYEFRSGGERLFFVEAKKPSVDILEDSAPAFQLRRYGWSGNLRFSVLTNFERLCIYDCTIMPVEGDSAAMALLARFHYSEFEEKAGEIYSLLSKESVLANANGATTASPRRPYRAEPFDKCFLRQIESWRLALGRDLAQANPSADSETVDFAVQRILNRVLFLRFCEDRNLERYEALKDIRTVDELKALFAAADRKWDSGLFAMMEEDRLRVSDETLPGIFQSLYYPQSPYEFGVIDPYVIDQIYEQFLLKSLQIGPDCDVSLADKPEAIDAQGAVVTPKIVAELVVERTLRPLLAETAPLALRIADICCGAGNFLVAAFEFLLRAALVESTDIEENARAAERRGDIIRRGTDWALSFSRRREILKKCIFGVDVDPLATEIAKFSLLVKLLEGISPGELEDFRVRTGEKPLPDLDTNIRCGNSLVGNDFIRGRRRGAANRALLGRVRPFNFSTEFPFGGFSAIVGNPPYVRVQNLVKYSREEYDYFKDPRSGFETAASETLDKYELFVERSLSLLAPGGIAGCLVPHKFMTNKAGRNLRGLLSRIRAVRGFVHFGTVQLFAGRTTYPCVLVLGKEPSSSFSAEFVHGAADLQRLFVSHDLPVQTFPADILSPSPWVFPTAENASGADAAYPGCRPLSDFADVFVGLQTSANSIFIFPGEPDGGGNVRGTDRKGETFLIEAAILRPCLYKESLTGYCEPRPNRYLLFPYRATKDGHELIPPEEMRTRHPLAWRYLNRFKKELASRDIGVGSVWYAFGRSQSIDRFTDGEHLVWSVLSRNAAYAYDTRSTAFTGGGNGPYYGLALKAGVQESLLYLLALLQHGPAEQWIEARASHFRGGYYSHSRQFMDSIPIVPVDFGIAPEKRTHNAIVAAARRVIELKRDASNAGTSHERVSLERLAAEEETRLATLVAARYRAAASPGAEANGGMPT